LKFSICFGLVLIIQNSCALEFGTGQDNRSAETVITEKKKVSDEKETLAKRFDRADPDTAAIIRSDETEVTDISAPFLRSGRVYRLQKFSKTRPIVIYVGIDEKEFSTVLSGNQDGFVQLLANAGVKMDSPDLRIAVSKAYLETTKSSDERLQVVSDVQEISPRPNLDEKQKKDFEAFIAKYAKIVAAPKCGDAVPYECIVFAVHDQDLAEIELKLFPDGKIQRKEALLEKGLLIPYAL